MDKAPSYHPRDFPHGVDEFLNAIPFEQREEVLRAIIQAHHQGRAEEEWIGQRIQAMIDLPDILYKYVPCESLRFGLPTTLRATQPSALNDVMEGNIITVKEGNIDREDWYALLSRSLREIFDEDALTLEELERRKNLFGDPRVSTIIRDHLSRFVGVISFSSDPLIPTMWAHYAKNSGFVVGYRKDAIEEFGVDLKRVLYMKLAPAYAPTRDNVVRLYFTDEDYRKDAGQTVIQQQSQRLLSDQPALFQLRRDWRELAKALFVKGETWAYEREVRLIVDLANTKCCGERDGYNINVLELPNEAVEEVYVGFNTPESAVKEIERVIGVGRGCWKLKYTDSHAYRMQVTMTSTLGRCPAEDTR